MKSQELRMAIESLLLVSDEPLSAARAAQVAEVSESQAQKALDELAEELRAGERGIQVRRVAGGYRLFTHPAHAHLVEKLVLSWDSRRLTQAAIETLAIIAYKQPVTKIAIGSIRGVNVDGAVASLLTKGLIKEVGREKSPGSPILYGTTEQFLEKFGLASIKDLPALADFEPDMTVRAEIEAGLSGGSEEPAAESQGQT